MFGGPTQLQQKIVRVKAEISHYQTKVAKLERDFMQTKRFNIADPYKRDNIQNALQKAQHKLNKLKQEKRNLEQQEARSFRYIIKRSDKR